MHICCEILAVLLPSSVLNRLPLDVASQAYELA